MDDRGLTRRLATLVPPDLVGARERAALAASERVALPAPRRGAFRLRVAAALCLVAAAGFVSPPGQAVATWIAEQVGIGQPGGAPTLGELREFFTEGTIADGVPAYVIARGPVPRGGHYEFITFKSKADGERCFELNLPEARSSYGGGCESLPAKGGVQVDFAGSNIDPDQEMQFIGGRASADVESVQVEFNGQPVATEITAIDSELLAGIGIDRQFKVYMAFLSSFRHGGEVDVVARDGAGLQVGGAELELFDVEAARAHLCAEMRREKERGGAVGRGPGFC